MQKTLIREIYEHYEPVLEPWQIKLAISRLKAFRVPLRAWEDMMQELAIRILAFRFDPDKAHAASEETILCRRLDQRIWMLKRAEARHRARVKRLARLRQVTEDTAEPQDRPFEQEVREAIAALSPRQQEVCQELMQGRSVHQIAVETDQDWKTIDRHVARIRRMFTERGLDLCLQ